MANESGVVGLDMTDEDYFQGEIRLDDAAGDAAIARREEEIVTRARADFLTRNPDERLKRTIRSKSQWQHKIFDETIANKYRSDAQEQGVSGEVVEEVLAQLRREATYILGLRPQTSGRQQPSQAPKLPPFDLEQLKRAVAEIQENLAKNDTIREPLEEKGNDIWMADDVVPESLRELLASRLDAIANLPEKDFHPDTNEMVQDLIHPSMFPYIEGVSSCCVNPSELPEKSFVSLWNRQYEDSTYQWLPAEFRVSEDGSVRIESYINNLDENHHSDLYRGIELLFQIFVPLFEKLTFQKIKLKPKLTLRNRKVQVIVKACNYIIPPKGQIYEGSWHVEGMSHECILASGIYYYSTSPHLKDEGLAFRRERDEFVDFPQVDVYDWYRREEMGDDFPSTEGLTQSVELGAVPTLEGRLLVFPNDLQHKVCSLTNQSDHQEAARKILVFFLVDPDKGITSTRHVPPQQWKLRVPELATTLSLVARHVTGQNFCSSLIQNIVSRAKTGLMMEEARQHRLELMRERKYKVDHDNEEWEREYSLCEH